MNKNTTENNCIILVILDVESMKEIRINNNKICIRFIKSENGVENSIVTLIGLLSTGSFE